MTALIWTLFVKCFIPSHSSRVMSAKSRSFGLPPSIHNNPKVFLPAVLDMIQSMTIAKIKGNSTSGVLRGVDIKPFPPPSRPFLVVFHHVIICIAKIMGLLHASGVQRKVRYFTVTQTLNSITTLILTNLVPKKVVRVFKNLG